jgi:MFS family permease
MIRTWLSKNLIVLTFVSLAQDAASELLYPLLPILLTGVIGAAPLALGVIEGAAEAAAGFAKLISGKSSDRFGRKPFVIAGYSLAGVGKGFVVIATSWPLVFFGRVTDRIGKGMRSAPRDALIADTVAPENLGKAFGFHRTGDNIGAVIGPGLALIGLALLNGDVRAVAKWALIPAIISALLTLLIREKFVKPVKQEHLEKVKARKPLSKSLKRTISVLVLIQLTNIPDALLLLRLHDIGFSTNGVVLSYMLFSAVTVLAAYPAGAVADRLSPQLVYAFGLSAFALAYFILGTTQNHIFAVCALALYGIFPALTDGVGKAWIAKLSQSDQKGHAQGVYQAAMNFAVLGAGIWGGLMWSKNAIQIPLIVAATGAAIGGSILAVNHLLRARP